MLVPLRPDECWSPRMHGDRALPIRGALQRFHMGVDRRALPDGSGLIVKQRGLRQGGIEPLEIDREAAQAGDFPE